MVWSYEIAKRKAGGNGNYLLITFSGKNRGQVSKKAYPPNYLKRFIHRNPEIPDSDSEYGSDNEDLVPASQESGIASQEFQHSKSDFCELMNVCQVKPGI